MRMSKYLEIGSDGSATMSGRQEVDDSQVSIGSILNRYHGREDELLQYLQSRCGQDEVESPRQTRSLESVGRKRFITNNRYFSALLSFIIIPL